MKAAVTFYMCVVFKQTYKAGASDSSEGERSSLTVAFCFIHCIKNR